MIENFLKDQLMKMKPGELTDIGFCPTCFDRKHNGCIFKDKKEETVVYEDNDFIIKFVGNPRNIGHMMISTRIHYHDMSEAPDELNDKIFRFAKELMKILVSVYYCERVYMCTMSDGLANHYHIQLIPRYSEEKRGSSIFVKPREEYIFNEEKFNQVKEMIQEYAKTQIQHSFCEIA